MIRVVRETGGLGDIVRVTAALDGLGILYPREPIDFCAPARYRDLVMAGHCAGMNRPGPGCTYTPTDDWPHRRRGAPLTGVPATLPHADRTIDLHCPAWRHERDTCGAPTKGRTALFCAAAGVAARPPTLRLNPDDDLRADHLTRQLDTRITIGLHATAAGLIRRWPPARWLELSVELGALGLLPLWIDAAHAPIAPMPGMRAVGLPWGDLMGLLSRLRLVIGIDSGILHLAAAVGTRTIGLYGPTNAQLVSGEHARASYVQARRMSSRCMGVCYGYNERGFGTNPVCATRGCANLAGIAPQTVARLAGDLMARRAGGTV